MKKTTRRQLARQFGVLAGASLAAPAWAKALVATPKQVEGPFYPPEPHAEADIDLTRLDGHEDVAQGEVILVRGRVTDTRGNPLKGVRVDLWQANDNGRYSHPDDPNTAPLDPHFQGIGITHTNGAGEYGFKTIKPAAYPLEFLGEGGWRARHIHFKFSHPNAADLTTQMYFEGDELLDQDLEIARVPEAHRGLLITRAETDPDSGLPLHRFNIALA